MMIRSIEHYNNIIIPDLLRKQRSKSFLSITKICTFNVRAPLNVDTSISRYQKNLNLDLEFFKKNYKVTCSMLTLEVLTGQKATLKIIRRSRSSKIQKNSIFSTYTTLRKKALGLFIDFLIYEMLPTSFQFEALRLKKVKNVNSLNLRTNNMLPFKHLHESVTSFGNINIIATPYIENQKCLNKGKMLLSLYQLPFKALNLSYLKSL